MRGILLFVLVLCCTQGFAQKQKLTILGSSSAEGVGASVKDSSWVGRLRYHYSKVEPVLDTLYNLAKRGKDPYYAMPSSYTPPPGRSLPNKDSNITRAVALKGKYLIVSFSSNNYDVFSFAEIHFTLKTIRDSALKAGMICYISSSQPRTEFDAAGRLRLKQVKDSIMKWFGSYAINFFDPVVDPTDLSILAKYRYSKDGIHLNDLGHRILFEQVLAKKIFNAPANLFVTTKLTMPACYGGKGTIQLTAYGGTAPYQYSSNGGTSYQTSNVFSLPAGSYSMRVKDAAGKLAAITATITQPAQLKIRVGVAKILCYNTKSRDTVFASGGTAPYTYSVNGGAYQTSRYFSLLAGTYVFTVKDSKGCIVSSPSTVITQPAALSLTTTNKTPPSCIGASNGSMTVLASGGTSPYLYAINGGTYGTSNKFTGLAAGNYSLSVKDKNNCVRTITTSLAASTTACVAALAPAEGQLTEFSKLSVAPNPSRGQFTIRFEGVSAGDRILKIYNLSGRVISTRVTGAATVEVGADLRQGIYILEVHENGLTTRQKLIKQ